MSKVNFNDQNAQDRVVLTYTHFSLRSSRFDSLETFARLVETNPMINTVAIFRRKIFKCMCHRYFIQTNTKSFLTYFLISDSFLERIFSVYRLLLLPSMGLLQEIMF